MNYAPKENGPAPALEGLHRAVLHRSKEAGGEGDPLKGQAMEAALQREFGPLIVAMAESIPLLDRVIQGMVQSALDVRKTGAPPPCLLSPVSCPCPLPLHSCPCLGPTALPFIPRHRVPAGPQTGTSSLDEM
jgi:hypothetical protein